MPSSPLSVSVLSLIPVCITDRKYGVSGKQDMNQVITIHEYKNFPLPPYFFHRTRNRAQVFLKETLLPLCHRGVSEINFVLQDFLS